MTHMAITRDEVAHLARLSRLALTDAELDHFAGQLDQIIGAVARVQEVAAEGIPPMTHAVPVVNVFRDDVIVPQLQLTPEQALAGAPATEQARFRVPRILTEEP
jgi:aspartyl-tRNA(Asn)/glutamyl-tRNA(Gln) amidotransferase subunit C